MVQYLAQDGQRKLGIEPPQGLHMRSAIHILQECYQNYSTVAFIWHALMRKVVSAGPVAILNVEIRTRITC